LAHIDSKRAAHLWAHLTRMTFHLLWAADCVDSYDREHHEVSLKYMKDKIASVMTNNELRSVSSTN